MKTDLDASGENKIGRFATSSVQLGPVPSPCAMTTVYANNGKLASRRYSRLGACEVDVGHGTFRPGCAKVLGIALSYQEAILVVRRDTVPRVRHVSHRAGGIPSGQSAFMRAG